LLALKLGAPARHDRYQKWQICHCLRGHSSCRPHPGQQYGGVRRGHIPKETDMSKAGKNDIAATALIARSATAVA
jgi:hypothetical protein